MPISDQEMAIAGTEGPDALNEAFDQAQIDVFDWHRGSVVAE